MTAGRAGCALLLLMLCAAGCRRAPPDPGTIVVGMADAVVNLDPRVGADAASQKVHQLLFSTLMRIDPQLHVVPDLAETLEQPDPVTYVARLKHGVRFHNGRELTSDDVVYTFRSFLDPAFKGRSGAYRQVAAVNAIDRYAVEFKLKAPAASFPINLVMGIVQAGSGAANASAPIGTGPYRLVRFVADDRVELAAFDGYYGGRPANDGLVLKVIPDDTMRGLELRKGTVDLVVNDLSPDIVWQLQQEGRMQVATAPGTDYAYLGMNLQDPALGRIEVRKAIGYAIDRAAIIRYLRRGFAAPAVGIVPSMSWAVEPGPGLGDGVAQLGHRHHRQYAGEQRAGANHDLVSSANRSQRVGMGCRVGRNERDARQPRGASDGVLPFDLAASDVGGLEGDRLPGGGNHPSLCAEEIEQQIDGPAEVSRGLGQAGEEDVADRVPGQLVGRKAVFEGVGPRVALGRQRDEAASEVPGRRNAEGPPQPPGRAAVVGHRHHTGDRAGVPADGSQRGRQSVPASERDHVGSGHRRSR